MTEARSQGIISRSRLAAGGMLLAAGAGLGCMGPMPSEHLSRKVTLPVPRSAAQPPPPDRLSREDRGEKYVLSPLAVISLAFDLRPDIKSSFQTFKSEEARYDFFYVSRDSFTPRLSIANTFDESRENNLTTRERDHKATLSAKKDFFDTTSMEIGLGFDAEATDSAIGEQPFGFAKLRYPLWGSRKKLERTSEDIFRQNELNDAQLSYIQQTRSRLRQALFKFNEVVYLEKQLVNSRRWKGDLEELAERITASNDRALHADRERLTAEITKVGASIRNQTGWYDIQLARLRSFCGLPFHAELEVVDEPFNPFEGATHEELLAVSLETDPEIATLSNSVRNAEVQLDLARRGKWDVALIVGGESDFEGMGEDEGVSDWGVSAGFDVSAVDPRVTESLTRQAQASIARFRQAIAARENAIFTDTLEPAVRIETLGASRDELAENLPRYQADYSEGVQEYLARDLNIDDLIERRADLYTQENEVARLTYLVSLNVAELCAATGKFFELLNHQAVQ